VKISGLLLIGILFAACAVGRSQQSVLPDDPYNVDAVKLLVQYEQGSAEVKYGFIEKRNGQLGDGVSIALLKAYTDQELLKPELVRAYLPVIKAAFASPGYVAHKVDLEPRVTLFLLHFLDNKLTDPALLKQVKVLESDLSRISPTAVRPAH
jgi:hypothetical protein